MTQLTDYELSTLDRISELIREGKLSDAWMVECLKLVADYSNLSSVKQYSQRNGISTQGTLKYRPVFKLAGFTVITDPQ